MVEVRRHRARASRVVGEMVDIGYARRTIVELTDAGQSILEAVRAYKFLIMGEFLSSWDPKYLTRLLPMLRNFGQSSEHT